MLFAPVTRRPAASQHSIDQAFERFFQGTVSASTAAQTSARPPAFTHQDNSFTLQLDVPGLAREQLSVRIEAAVVRIESLADAPRALKLAYELPQDIDAAASSATLEHGVLTLVLAKQVPQSQATSLTIQ